MDKVATPKDLAAELRTLLAYAEGPKPSREKLASDLQALAERTAKAPQLPGWSDVGKALTALRSGLSLIFPDVPDSELRSIVDSGISEIRYKLKARQIKAVPNWVR